MLYNHSVLHCITRISQAGVRRLDNLKYRLHHIQLTESDDGTVTRTRVNTVVINVPDKIRNIRRESRGGGAGNKRSILYDDCFWCRIAVVSISYRSEIKHQVLATARYRWRNTRIGNRKISTAEYNSRSKGGIKNHVGRQLINYRCCWRRTLWYRHCQAINHIFAINHFGIVISGRVYSGAYNRFCKNRRINNKRDIT